MTMDLLLKTAWLSLRQPREGLRAVLGWQLSLRESGLALLLMGIVSAGIGSLFMQVPPEADPISTMMLTNPLVLGIVQVIGLGLVACFIHVLGLFFKSRATLEEAVTMIAWMQALWVALFVAEVVTLLLLPPVGLLMVLVGTAVSLWLLISFTAELHGFESLFLTLLGVIAAFFAAMLAGVFLLFLALLLGIVHV